MEHIVRNGETLASIAQRYGVTIPAIMQANSLTSDTIYVGQRLFIPVQSVQPLFPPPQQQHHTHTHTHTHTHIYSYPPTRTP
jgi:LysM repeat protein